jgi:S1-C subfamily serine protease
MRSLRAAASFLLSAFVSACSYQPAFAEGWPVAAMNQTIEQTNFLVGRGCSGTLIAISPPLVLTAEHCIDNLYETVTRERIRDDGTVVEEKIRRIVPGTVTQLSFNSDALQVRSVEYRTKLVLADKRRDLALLQIMSPVPNTEAAVIACKAPVRGEVAYAVGNPKGILYASVTKGIISSVNRNYPQIGESEYDEAALYQTSATIVGGNSGGSLYNEAGHLVGVPVRGYAYHETIGYAVPLDDIKRFLTRVGINGPLWEDRCK